LLAKVHDLKQAAVSPAISLTASESRTLAAGASFAVPAVGAPGGSVEQTFTISNAGKTTLAVDAAGVTLVPGDGTESGCFSLSERPADTVAPGAASSFTIRFAPSAVGAKAAVLTIPSNDPAIPRFTINLNSNGLARDNAITAFGFVGAATIPVGDAASTIDYTLPYNMSASIGALRAVFVTTGSSVTVGDEAQTSGVTVNDFSAAADGGTRDYYVKISAASNPRVFFDANGGSGAMDPQEIPANSTAPLKTNAFSRKGYDFDDWAITASGTKAYLNQQNFSIGTADAMLYALWKPTTYTIAFDANGGSGTMASQSVVFGQSINLSAESGITPPSGTPAYVFKGWATSAESPGVAYANSASLTMTEGLVPAAGVTITLYAVWEATVSFDANGGTGTVSAVKANRYGNATLSAGTGFSRGNYQLAGWSALATNNGVVDYAAGTGYTLGATNVTLYAVWWPLLSFSANGGTGTMTSVARQPNIAAALTANAFSRGGYIFRGWATSASSATVAYLDQVAYTMGSSPATLYAAWRGTLTLNGNGATSGSMAAQPWDCHGTGSLPGNPYLRNGYSFQGWATSSNTTTVSHANLASYTMGASSATLYAVWQGTITFNANGGSGTMASQLIGTGRGLTLAANAFTRAGYTFAGWATGSSGAVAYANGATYDASSGTATLYARWSRSVSYNANNATSGTVPVSSSFVPGLGATAAANTGGLMYLPGGLQAKKFVGWNTQANGSGTSYAANASFTMPDTDLVLYAQWTPYAVGDIGPAGGWVALARPADSPFTDGATQRWYIEAAPADLEISGNPIIHWDNGSYATSVANCYGGPFNGKHNTATIIAARPTGGSAALHCDNYSVNGYSDWFLPDREELQLLRDNLAFANIGGFVRSDSNLYWTSNPWTYPYANCLSMASTTVFYDNTANGRRVRPVRYF
jgi:uncharacterized repeat protein (TIGR02543 family)